MDGGGAQNSATCGDRQSKVDGMQTVFHPHTSEEFDAAFRQLLEASNLHHDLRAAGAGLCELNASRRRLDRARRAAHHAARR